MENSHQNISTISHNISFTLNFQIYKWNSCIICTQKPLPLVEMIRFHRCVNQQVNWVDKGFWDQGTNGLVFLHSLISICVERATKKNTPYCLNYKAMQITTSIQMFVVSMFFFFWKECNTFIQEGWPKQCIFLHCWKKNYISSKSFS